MPVELGVSRDGGYSFDRPFRAHLGYPKYLSPNEKPNQFDSGVLWPNAHLVPSVDGKTQRIFYGAYSKWSTLSNSGIGMAEVLFQVD